MGKVKLKEIRMYASGQWRRLHGIDKIGNDGEIYAQGYWRGFWPPSDGIYLKGDWYVMGDGSGTEIPDPPKPPVPEIKTNKITVRRKDWLADRLNNVWKFGLRLECQSPADSNLIGWIDIKRQGEKDSEAKRLEFLFKKGGMPYSDYNSQEEVGFRVFVDGAVVPPKDGKFEYIMGNTKGSIIS